MKTSRGRSHVNILVARHNSTKSWPSILAVIRIDYLLFPIWQSQ
jgi:hypothetical protein